MPTNQVAVPADDRSIPRASTAFLGFSIMLWIDFLCEFVSELNPESARGALGQTDLWCVVFLDLIAGRVRGGT